MTHSPISTNLIDAGYLRLKDVLRLFPVSKSTWWLGVQLGRYPKPVKLSDRITAWRVTDIQNLLADIARQNKLVAQDSSSDNATLGSYLRLDTNKKKNG